MANYEKGERHYLLGPLHRKPVWDRGWGADWGARGPLTVGPITQKTSLGQWLWGGGPNNKGGPQTTPSSEILHKMTLNLLSVISYLLSLILFHFKMAFIYKKITKEGYKFYIGTYFQGTSHIPTSAILCQFHILPCCLAMTAKQHGRIWKWIQNNLEIYRNLRGTIYKNKPILLVKADSIVVKMLKPVLCLSHDGVLLK